MSEAKVQLKRARQGKQIQWRKLVNVRDMGDIVSILSSASRLMNQRGQRVVGQVGHNIRDNHFLEDVINIVDRLGKLVVRKSREFEEKGIEAVHTVEQEVRESPVVERIESRLHAVEQEVRQSPVVEQIESRLHRKEKQEQARRQAERAGDANVFVIGTLLGTLLGALIALWFAPRSGEATRHEIENTAQEVRRRVEGESLQDAIEAGKAEARRLQQTINSR